MKFVRVAFVVGAGLVASMEPSTAGAGVITILGQASSQGYQFTNFDGPTPNGQGTFINGIANSGSIVGFTTADGQTFQNFTANPLASLSANSLNINGSATAMANGINSAGTVVGSDGLGNAFTLSGSNLSRYVPGGSVSATAFGINDNGITVGQSQSAAGTMPGYVLNGTSVATIHAPSGPDTVNAQGINNNGLIVGFFLGNDGQDHGLMGRYNFASPTSPITATALLDPRIPPVAGEPGATFVFSQLLGINDQGIAVGYYGDSTGSQHGFFYNTNSGQYTFLDDPNAGFSNGVAVTQITGINNAGEIAGFYTDANGLAHGFVATPSAVPEPGSVILTCLGLASAVGLARRSRPTVG